jgi:hypothetical protein
MRLRQQDIHGTNSCYVRARCRCDECTQAHREYTQRYRANLYKRGFKFRDGYLVAPAPDEAVNND